MMIMFDSCQKFFDRCFMCLLSRPAAIFSFNLTSRHIIFYHSQRWEEAELGINASPASAAEKEYLIDRRNRLNGWGDRQTRAA
jgi:hypothetical protein